MKSLSFWAAKNIWPARLLLTFSYLLLIGMALMASDILSESGKQLPGYLLPAAILVYMVVCALYPSKRDRQYRNYGFRKSCDFVLVICSLLMIVSTASLNTKRNASAYSVASAAHGDPTVKTKKEKRQIKKEQLKKLKALYKELKAVYKNGPKGTKAMLIVLSSIVAAGLLLLVLGISCNLACSGAGAASTLVLVLGTGLVIFLLIRVIRGIRRKYNPLIKESEKQPEPKTS